MECKLIEDYLIKSEYDLVQFTSHQYADILPFANIFFFISRRIE
jgi:hypothetical protein